MKEKECKYCKQIIQYEKKQQLAAHVGSCKENPKRQQFNLRQTHKLISYKLNCVKCDTEFSVLLSENHFNNKTGKYRKYCSRKCANTHIIKESTKQKTSNTIKLLHENTLTYTNSIRSCTSCKINYCECEHCKSIFTMKYNKKRKYCSPQCLKDSEAYTIAGRKAGLASVQSQNRISRNEIVFAEFCRLHFANVETNKAIFNGWDADVIIHDLKIAILWNGKWHYEKCNSKHSVKQVQNRDQIKIKEIIKCGYTPYIIKDMGKFNLNKVQTEWILFNFCNNITI